MRQLFRKGSITTVVTALLASTVMTGVSYAQSAENFEEGIKNNEAWNFLTAARSFDNYYDQAENCLNELQTPSFLCIDARLESALNFINVGKFTEGRTRISEARNFARSSRDVSQGSSVAALDYGSLYARSFQYEALRDLRLGKSAAEVSANTGKSRQLREEIRTGLRNFDGRVVSSEAVALAVDAEGNLVISDSLAQRISPKFDVGPTSQSNDDIGATYGRFETSEAQQLAIQDAQSYLIEAYAYAQENQTSAALNALNSAEQSLLSPRGVGNSQGEPVSTSRAPFLWASIKGEKADQEILQAAADTDKKREIATRFEDEVIEGIFGSAYQDSKLKGLMLLRLAELRNKSGEFTSCRGNICGLDAVQQGVKVITTNIDNPTVDNQWIEPLLSAIYDNRNDISNWEKTFYSVMQVGSQSEVAADAAEAVIRLKEDEGSSLGQTLKQLDRLQFAFRDADRELEIMRARRIAGETIPDSAFEAKRSQVAEISSQLDNAREAFQASEDGQRFAQLVSSSVDLREIQSSLDDDEGYSRIVLGKDQGYALLITSDTVEITEIDRNRVSIQEAVEELRCAVDFVDPFKRYTCAQNSDDDSYDIRFPEYDVKLAAGLFDDIYGEISTKLVSGEIKHLIVQPDAVLAPLPFAALVTTAPEKIGEGAVKHINFDNGSYDHDYTGVSWLSDSVAVSHSVGELSFVQARDKSRRGVGVKAPKPFLGFSGFDRFEQSEANMIATKKQVDPTTCAGVYRGFGDIAESTNRQAQTIQSQIGGDLVLNNEFTDTKVLNASSAETEKALKDYRVILFATHSISPGPLTEGCLDEPVLTTNYDPNDLGSDGFLTASDIASGMELAADLVILSACETAVGSAVSTFSDRPTSETFDGIVRAFYFAQAQSLLATHWTLPANETVNVFSQLFQQEGLSETAFAERLRQTQVNTRNSQYEGKSTSHPYFWANFVFVGDGRAKLDL